jgi:hypothetical protein
MEALDWLVEQVNSDCLNSTFIRKELIDQAKQIGNNKFIEAMLDIDMKLALIEDYAKGEVGTEITKLRSYIEDKYIK